MKNNNKFMKKVATRLFEEDLKKGNYSEEKKEELRALFQASLNSEKKLDEPIDKVEERIKNSIHIKDGKHYTLAMEFMTNELYLEVFKKVLFSMLTDNEVMILYDESVLNDGAIFLLYKKDKKLMCEYIFKDDTKQMFEIENDMLSFSYPKNEKMSKHDRELLMMTINQFNISNRMFIYNKDLVDSMNENDKDVYKTHRRLKFLGYFWSYGIIALALVLSIIFGIVFVSIASLAPYIKYAIGLSLGIPIISLGLDYILACRFKFKHILIVNQIVSHKKIDPDNLNWNDLFKKEFIIIGILFMIMGIVFIVLSFVL